jgi:FAD/FMN-containing dehydrogenase
MLESLQEIAGDRVSSSLSERCCHSSDASQVSGRPDFVVRPANNGEVSRILLLCNERDVPVVARGAGSGLAGGATPVSGLSLIHITEPTSQISME